MTAISGKKGKDLLLDVINELKRLDPKIVPLDSDEIEDLEINISSSIRDVFGKGSPEYKDFKDFRIAAGHISRGDSRAEKLAKFELGLPKAISRLEELFDLMESSEKKKEPTRDLPAEKMVAMGPVRKSQSPESRTDKPATAKTSPGAPRSVAKTVPPKPEAAPVSPRNQPGKILLLQSGGDDISFAVTALLDRIGVDVVMLEEDSPSNVMEAVTKDKIAFTLLCASSGQRGGLSGLTAVIAKPRPKHEVAFKLGSLVGRLGAGKVAILFSGERPFDLPEDLFGVLYLPYKEEGGWQIRLLKLLKNNSFIIDANLLFD